MADVTFTVKGIPEALHALLKESAERNRRSLNSEILVRLEGSFAAPAVDGGEQLRRVKALAASLPRVDHGLVDTFKRRGRA